MSPQKRDNQASDANAQDGDVLSTPEVSAAITTLSAADQRRLERAARLLCRVNGLDDWRGLLQEAMVRAFEGRRRCPRQLGIMPFLFGAMRSIAHSDAKSAGRSPIDRFAPASDDREEVAAQPAANERADQVSPEREAAARHMLAKIDELFKDDPDAQMVLYAMAEGLQGEELRQELGLTATQHNTIRRRILRKTEALENAWSET